jgi:hypothetical protein
MRASRVLQKCLPECPEAMHATRSRVLLHGVEALLAGRRLTLMDVARSWPGAERVRAPLKAFDRLLSNPHLHIEREQVYGGMTRWLLRSERPVIAIGWSDLKPDKSWCLLRAAVPVGGRTLPVLDMVFRGDVAGSPAAEKLFLQHLRATSSGMATPLLSPVRSARRLYSVIRIGPRSPRQRLTHGANSPVAGAATITAALRARSDAGASMNSWGNLRL